MKRWIRIVLGTVMAAMCILNVTISAFAEENPGVSIPVTVSLSGTLPKPAEDFTVNLRADDASYPMPEGAEGDVYTMTITGEDTKNFPVISYDRVGVYTYTIYQTAGSNKKCTYDDTEYLLTIYITNAEDGSGLEAAAVLYPDSEGDKLPGAEFKNEYETVTVKPETPDTSKTPDTPKTSDAPKTGDETNPLLYAVLIAVSLGIIVTLFLTRRARRTEE